MSLSPSSQQQLRGGHTGRCGVHTDDALTAAPEYKSEEPRTSITLSCWISELCVSCDGHPLIPVHFYVAFSYINFTLGAVTEIIQAFVEYIKLSNGTLRILDTQRPSKTLPKLWHCCFFNYELKVCIICRRTENTLLPIQMVSCHNINYLWESWVRNSLYYFDGAWILPEWVCTSAKCDLHSN